MPSNNEDLLNEHLDEGDLPEFILSCAIACGVYPSEYILQKYGGGYGFDNFNQSHEELLNLKKSLVETLIDSRLSLCIDEAKILTDIEENYARENGEYCRLLNSCSQEIDKVDNMSIRVNKLEASNEAQRLLLNTIGRYFDLKRKKINERYEEMLKEPIMETFEQAQYRMFEGKIKELEDSIKTLEIQLLFDENFFIKIDKEWFTK